MGGSRTRVARISGFTWRFCPNVRYRRYFKIYDQKRDTRIRLLFLGRYLQRRLNARLRFGDTKAVYGLRANAVARGPALSFQIDAAVNQEHWAFAREVIDEELEALRTASTPASELETDRDAVVEQLIAQNREAEDLPPASARRRRAPRCAGRTGRNGRCSDGYQ